MLPGASSFGWEKQGGSSANEPISQVFDRVRSLFTQEGQDDSAAVNTESLPAGRASPSARQRMPGPGMMHEKAGGSADVPSYDGPGASAALLRQSPILPERHPGNARVPSPSLPLRHPRQDDAVGFGGDSPLAGRQSPAAQRRMPGPGMHEKGGMGDGSAYDGSTSASSHTASLLRHSPMLPERHPTKVASPSLPMRHPRPAGNVSPQRPVRELTVPMSPYMPSRQPGQPGQPGDSASGPWGSSAGSASAPSDAPAAFSGKSRDNRSPAPSAHSALTRGTPQMPMRHPGIGTPQPASRQPSAATSTPQPASRQPSAATGTPQPSMRQPAGMGTPSMPMRQPMGAAGTPQPAERVPKLSPRPGGIDKPALGPLSEVDTPVPSAGPTTGGAPAGAPPDMLGAGFADAASEAAKAWLERLRAPQDGASHPSTPPQLKQPQAEDPFEAHQQKPSGLSSGRERAASELAGTHMHPLTMPYKERSHQGSEVGTLDARQPPRREASPIQPHASPQLPMRDPTRKASVGTPQVPNRYPQQDDGRTCLGRVASPHMPSRFPQTPSIPNRHPAEAERSAGEQRELMRQLLRSTGITQPEGEQVDPIEVQRNNEYLIWTNQNLRTQMRQLEARLKDMKVRNDSLEQQNQEYKKFCERSQAGDSSGSLELGNLQQQLGAVVQLKDALNTECLELRERLKAAQQSTEDISEKKTCVVCMDNLPNVVCLPCKHLALCSICSQQCGLKQCPMCRNEIIDKMQVYLV